jgi:hypothetical protein
LVLNIPGIIDNKGSITFVLDWTGLWLMVFFTQMFENVQVENIITTTSDHFAVLLSLEKVAIKHEAFKYEATWCRAADYNDVVGKL